MQNIKIAVTRLPHGRNLPLPDYASTQAAGMDLLAAIDDNIIMQPGQQVMIPTGIAMALPAGYEAQIRPRSGLAAKYGVSVLNSPGTIDSDYRGEIKIILINHGQDDFTIRHGERIAQMIIAPVMQAAWQEVDHLPETERGPGGFGSTGTKTR